MKVKGIKQSMNYNVIEKFKSVNGEGIRSGQLTTFIRFFGCNLRCAYCDSAYSYDKNEKYEIMSTEEIIDYLKESGTKNVTLAGGEPMYQKGINELIEEMCRNGYSVEIETNGSIDIERISKIKENRPYITLDYKTSASGMERHNLLKNYDFISKNDSVKFVVGSVEDLETAYKVSNEYKLAEKANVLLSPVYGEIEPIEIVNFMMKKNWNGAKMQIQIHKVIWDAEMRGV